MFCSLLDRLCRVLVLRGFAKPGKLRNAAGFACQPQFLDRADVQMLVKRLDLFRAQAGNGEQIRESLLEIRRAVLRKISTNRFQRVP